MCHIIVHLERFYSEELNSVYGNVKGLTGFRQSCLPQFLRFFSLWLALLYQWLTENLPPKFNHNNVCCSSWRFWLPKARSRHVLQDYLKERWLFIQGGKFFTIDRNNYYYWFEQVWKVPCCRMLRTFFFLFYFTGETVKMKQVWILGYGLMIVKRKLGRLIFTKSFRKIRLDSKLNTTFWVVPSENFPQEQNIWRGSPV